MIHRSIPPGGGKDLTSPLVITREQHTLTSPLVIIRISVSIDHPPPEISSSSRLLEIYLASKSDSSWRLWAVLLWLGTWPTAPLPFPMRNFWALRLYETFGVGTETPKPCCKPHLVPTRNVWEGPPLLQQSTVKGNTLVQQLVPNKSKSSRKLTNQ